MCGICGLLRFDRQPVDQACLLSMTNSLAHRGPDGQGVYVAGGIGLGVRRLSIVDIPSGRQPIHNEDETIWTVFNGEIYNFREIRRDLERRGHKLYTDTDTEVIVHLYEDYGDEFVLRINGMFSIAIWDQANRRLVLARDRLGIKPLSYAATPTELIFGSEIRSILVSGRVPRSLDLSALDDYLDYGYVPAPKAILNEVRKLPPGHILTCQDGRLWLREYWEVPRNTDNNYDEDYCVGKLSEMLTLSIRRQMTSDVPLGAFLSGGIDSSAIVATMSHVLDTPVKTFSVGFKDVHHNELPAARTISRYFGTEHREVVVDDDVADILPKVIEAYGEPYADSSAVPTYLLARLAREQVSVVLSGEGSDELFAGYRRYSGAKKDAVLLWLPTFLREAAATFLGRWLRGGVALQSYLLYAAKTEEERCLQRSGITPPEVKSRLYSDDVRALLGEGQSYKMGRQYMLSAGNNMTRLEKMLYVDLRTYLPYDLLTKIDIAGMANSLETRVPFLDHELVEFAATIPGNFKVKGGVPKYVLRRTLSDSLPRETVNRPKHGLTVPLAEWCRGQLRELIYDTLTSRSFKECGVFSVAYIEREILNVHQARRADRSQIIWALLCFALWHQLSNGRQARIEAGSS